MRGVALAVCEADFTRAANLARTFVQLRTDIVQSQLPYLDERGQTQFLKTEWPWMYPIPIARLRPDDPEVAAATAECVLNGKAMALEILTERARLGTGGGGPEMLKALADLKAVANKITSESVARGDAAAGDPAFQALLKERAVLSKRVAAASPQVPRDRKWVALADLQATLPADAAVVEFLAVKDRDYKTDKEKAERYFAWVVRRESVHFVDLKTCEPIDSKISDLRAEMDFDRVKQAVQASENNAVKKARNVLEELSRLVLHPVAKHLEGVNSLVISPSEGLWLVPWPALITPAGKYLVEERTLSLVVTPRHLLPTGEKPPAPNPPVLFGNPAFGGTPAPAVGRGERNEYLAAARARGIPDRSHLLPEMKWDQLDGTQKEIDAIRPKVERLAGPAAVYVGEAATEAEFKKLARPRFLVLSTHGYFLPGRSRGGPPPATPKTAARLALLAPQGTGTVVHPAGKEIEPGLYEYPANGASVRVTVAVRYADGKEETREIELAPGKVTPAWFRADKISAVQGYLENPLVWCGLVMAGAKRKAAPGAADDGFLTGLEIVGTDLYGTELVVLSACETGAQDARTGESAAGLRHAFQLAGAKAVAATVWKIPDDETAELSVRMWEALANRKTPAQALAEAQRYMIGKPGHARHPYYWAAFNVTSR